MASYKIFFLKHLVFFLSIVISSCASIPCISHLKQVQITSSAQQMIKQDYFLFTGSVHIMIDDRFSIWADYVEFDKSQGIIIAQNKDGSPVCLEGMDIVFLADRLFLDIQKKTGWAENMTIQADEGYLSAKKAHKLDDSAWTLEKVEYTPCDAHHPHWRFNAKRASLRRGYLVKASQIIFNIGNFPFFFLPGLVFPIQSASKSGFLIPRFSYDYEFGLGYKQNYYWSINQHCDTTIGVDWRERRGTVFLDEFRWARSVDSFTKTNWWYAVARNSLLPRKGKVVPVTARRYWFSGKDFHNVQDMLHFDTVASLSRIDFGTDKRIGYSFFNSLDDVDDTFNNALIIRGHRLRDGVEMKVDAARTSVKMFTDLSIDDVQHVSAFLSDEQKEQLRAGAIAGKKEHEHRVTIAYAPHVEWNYLYRSLWNHGIRYRHDFYVDHVLYHQHNDEKFFVKANHIEGADYEVVPYFKNDVLRCGYHGYVYKTGTFLNQVVRLTCSPHVQFRSQIAQDIYANKNVFEQRVCARGSYRLFCEVGAEWALPEAWYHDIEKKHSYGMQPILTWSYVPKFYQDHWFYIDRQDRLYPKNEIALQVRNSMHRYGIDGDVLLKQGLELYDQKDIFWGRRGIAKTSLLPLSLQAHMQSDVFDVAFNQEYDWKALTILQSEVNGTYRLGNYTLGLGYVFQNAALQKERSLLSNIPHFLTVNASVPCSSHTMLYFDSQFYAEKNQHFGDLSKIRPLLQRVRLDYSGHCWGGYIGFEYKKYREYGVDRSERVFVFSLRLDSLGSFAKKFKGLPVSKRSR